MPGMKQVIGTITAWIWCLGMLLVGAACSKTVTPLQPEMLELAGDLRAHDPAMIRHADTAWKQDGTPDFGEPAPDGPLPQKYPEKEKNQ